MIHNLQQVLSAAQQVLISSDSAKLDAEVLLAAVLNKSRTFLRAFPETEVTEDQYGLFMKDLSRREQGEPIAYILQEKEFWSLPFKVTADVLVPRVETECLVETALLLLPNDTAWVVADLGTGSGAIALAVANERPRCHVIGSDVNKAALQIAQENAATFQLDNVEFIDSDWGSAFAEHSFDMIISNPPYIDVHDQDLEAAVQQFQPELALFAANNGLAAIRVIVQQAQSLLKSNGYLLIEHGFKQQADVVDILDEHHFIVLEQGKDVAGLPRYVVAHKKAPIKSRL